MEQAQDTIPAYSPLASPPTTVGVRKKLLSYRASLEDFTAAQAAGNDVGTPECGAKSVTFNLPMNGRPSSAESTDIEGSETLSDILLYTNPAASFLVVLVCVVTLSTVYVTSSSREWTVLSAICYLLLAQLGLNFVRSLLSSSLDAGNSSESALARGAVHAATRAVHFAAEMHDRFLTVRDPQQSLRVAGGLWGLAVLGRYFTAWALATLAFTLAFTVPFAVHTHSAAVFAAYAQAMDIVKSRWDALGLTRKQRAGALLFATVMLWWRSAWTTRLVGILLGALAVRCNLKPAEMAAIRQHAEPLTMSVKKRAARLSLAATDFAHRALGSKAHLR